MKGRGISGVFRSRFLGALAVAAALSSGASMAVPMPPHGSLLVTTYYLTADRTEVVGVRVHGNATCQSGPYPLDWGLQTAYSSLDFYACEGSGGGGPWEL